MAAYQCADISHGATWGGLDLTAARVGKTLLPVSRDGVTLGRVPAGKPLHLTLTLRNNRSRASCVRFTYTDPHGHETEDEHGMPKISPRRFVLFTPPNRTCWVTNFAEKNVLQLIHVMQCTF